MSNGTRIATKRQPAKQGRSRSFALLASLLGVILIAGVSLAPNEAFAKRKRSSSSRTVSFEDDVVETSYLRPESSVVESINSRTRTSLIRIRMDFFKEIVRSATQL